MLNVKILIALYLVTDTVNNTHVLSDRYSKQYTCTQ